MDYMSDTHPSTQARTHAPIHPASQPASQPATHPPYNGSYIFCFGDGHMHELEAAEIGTGNVELGDLGFLVRDLDSYEGGSSLETCCGKMEAHMNTHLSESYSFVFHTSWLILMFSKYHFQNVAVSPAKLPQTKYVIFFS